MVTRGTTGNAAVETCLEHLGRATCVEMAQQDKASSRRVDGPRDCLKTMSKEECEAVLSAQQAARGRDESVDLEKCVDNPTPKCEAVLRPILEAQRSGGESADR